MPKPLAPGFWFKNKIIRECLLNQVLGKREKKRTMDHLILIMEIPDGICQPDLCLTIYSINYRLLPLL